MRLAASQRRVPIAGSDTPGLVGRQAGGGAPPLAAGPPSAHAPAVAARPRAQANPVRIRSAEPEAHVASVPDLPAPGPPEVALLGRSNAGKSSLLNRLVGRRQLARTSATPGKTRILHVYRVARPEGELRLVDLPGWGWARVSRAERARWRALVEGYLEARPTLRVALVLQDVRRDPGEDEALLVAWLAERGIPVVVAVTKCDKPGAAERERRLAALRKLLPVQADWIVPTSARTGAGIEDLWRVLDTLL